MRRSFQLFLALVPAPLAAAGLAAGCGPSVVVGDPHAGSTGGGGDSNPWNEGGGGAGAPRDGGKSDLDVFVDPGCPDAGPAAMDFACDPYHQGNNDCPPGDGCYIFVKYPDEPCGQEVYGSRCAPAGVGGQGRACGGPAECQAGFVCAVTGSGNQCVQLCELSGNDGCPPGLVCEPIDVEGFGGCL